jgi:hypothetical protein
VREECEGEEERPTEDPDDECWRPTCRVVVVVVVVVLLLLLGTEDVELLKGIVDD